MLEGSNHWILLDRDGVLNVDTADSVKSLDELEIEPGAALGCEILRTAGYRLAVITNQSAVGRGHMTLATLCAVNDELDRALGGVIDRWYICPHAPDDGCRCRKPDTLLFEQARADLGFNPADTWFVGDAPRDLAAARRFGCRAALVLSGKGAATAASSASDDPNIPTWTDLEAFAVWLTRADDWS